MSPKWELPETLPDLREEIEKRGYIKRHGKLLRIEVENNLLGIPTFHMAHFEDGFYCTFCPGYDYTFWWRHEGGGRYGYKGYYRGYRKSD